MENNVNKLEFEAKRLELEVYTIIANWYNNNEYTDKERKEALKLTSRTIIQTIIEGVMGGLGEVKVGMKVERGGQDVEKVAEAVRANEGIQKRDSFDKLFKR